METILSSLLIDDDPDSLRFLKWRLGEHFPKLRTATTQTARGFAGFDIYFIDNDFGGKHHALELTRSLRESSPESLIIVFSGKINDLLLKDLINAGCDGICSKGNPGDLDTLMRITKAYIDTRSRQMADSSKMGLGSTIESIRMMLREWNERLLNQHESIEEKAS